MDDSAVPAANSELTFPSGTEVYDGIMASVEPELVSANIPHLDEAYVGESAEDRKKRYARYTKAFKKYDALYEEWNTTMNQAVTEYRKDALRSAEEDSRTAEAAALAQMDADFEATVTVPSQATA